MSKNKVEVLIVGGGPSGLSALLLLARQGISSRLIERHPRISNLPRSRGVNTRTMEVLRSVGLEEQLQAIGPFVWNDRFTLAVDTLAGKELYRILPQGPMDFYEQVRHLSPTTWCLCPQNDLELLLAETARQSGAELQFGVELLSCEQDASEVKAEIIERETGVRHTIYADYLIAADGANSFVRHQFGIGRSGHGIMAHYINIQFRADLTALVHDRPFIMCFITTPQAESILYPVNDTDRWILMVSYDPEKGKQATDFTPHFCEHLVRSAIGDAHIPIEILGIYPWIAAAHVADHFQVGRLLLVGDAAHEMPPFAAFGVNVGIQDSHNLAWKLALVLKGLANPSLLSTYEDERKPIGQFTTEHSSTRLQNIQSRQTLNSSDGKRLEQLEQQFIAMLGYHYRSLAVIPETDETSSDEKYGHLSGRPGTRAPHIWVERAGSRISTLDLFDKNFVLLTGKSGNIWKREALVLAHHLGLSLDAYCLDDPLDLMDTQQQWCKAYGVDIDGAVLVRPDAFVAWRARRRDLSPRQALMTVFDRLLCRPPLNTTI